MWKNGNRTYVYGGTLNGTSGNFVTFDPRNVGDDMWVMESGGCWTEVARSTSPVWPLALSGHTATAVEHKVFIIGGRSVYPTFNPSIYVYDMQTQLWSTPRVEGSAHATVRPRDDVSKNTDLARFRITLPSSTLLQTRYSL